MKRSWPVLIFAFVALSMGRAPCRAGGVLPPHSTVAGQTIGEWSVQWWQWQLSFPVSVNPSFDDTGAHAGLGNVGPVFFLTGSLAPSYDPLNVVVNRAATISANQYIFVPLLNALFDNSLFPPPGGPFDEAQLRRQAADSLAGISELRASIDGVEVPNLFDHRELSPPGFFSYTLPDEDNVAQYFGADLKGTVADAVSDGYYLMLNPLTLGSHTIQFGGTIIYDPNDRSQDFHLDITYRISVVPEPAALSLAGIGGLIVCGYAWRKGARTAG